MDRTLEELIASLREQHNERVKSLPSQEKLLEAIREEGLLDEALTVSETEDGLVAVDHAGGMLLWLTHRDDGSIELAWAEEGRPIDRREVFDVPGEAYLNFLLFLESSKDRSERERAEEKMHGKAFEGLLKRYFG